MQITVRLAMSVSILEVIEAGGYDLTTLEDAEWLLCQVNEFEELVEKAQDLVDDEQDRQNAIDEAEYQARFGDEE